MTTDVRIATPPRTTSGFWAHDLLRTSVVIPNLGGFQTHYGIRVADIGEDGDMVALGHIGELRALAAFNRHARTVWGFKSLNQDGFGEVFPAHEALDAIEHIWMTNDRPLDDWWLRRAAGPGVYGAFPVTYYSAE